MDIVLIGSGNAATVLGRKSMAAGHRIVQVYSRNGDHANVLAIRLGTHSTSYISSIERKADLMIIALRDEALPGFVKDLGKVNSLVVHTAGSLSINEVEDASDRYGVLYPLQSLRKEIEAIPPLTLLVDGNETQTKNQLLKFASSIGNIVIETDDNTRLRYHLAATIVNNFTNHLFAATESFCKKENISFAVLQPLMEETVLRLRRVSPADSQTGPAVRSDHTTMEKHKNLLQENPDLLKLYNQISDEIQKSASGFRL